VAVGLLATVLVAAPAWATPASGEPAAAPSSNVNLRLDGRAAGRLLADSDSSLEGDKVSDDKTKADDKAGGEKPDEMKLTVTKGGAAKPKAAGSDDSLAFLKDWPFWAIVGGVIIVGAATFMIVENHNQKHPCSSMYDAGCFGAK
jgi:hypothetical protein